MKDALIAFEDVSKIYGSGPLAVHALDHVSFTIDEGDFCVIVGASGAGKTTLLNILGGMETATGGTIRLGNDVVSSFDDARREDYRRFDVGFVFQFYNLIGNLTALENVEIAAHLSDDPMDAHEALELVGLTDKADRFPAQLSGGQQQCVSIARAIAKRPRLLLCDEPTGALDDTTGKEILKVLQDICRLHHTTVVVITHNAALTQMADCVIRLRSGQVVSLTRNTQVKPAEEIEW